MGRKTTLTMTAGALAIAGLFHAAPAAAANHALIMWIGEYANPSANLPGIDRDGQHARRIADAMGVPVQNVYEYKNREMTMAGIAGAFRMLADRVQPNDKVFIYYSGHGGQVAGRGGARCTEGMVSHDLDLYVDASLQSDLERLASRSSQIVMLNDSCFSGGQATALDKAPDKNGAVPKFYAGALKASSGRQDGPACGDAVNKVARTLEAIGREKSNNVLYVAASANNEVSFATPRGSTATVAWATCIGAAADRDHSGALTGEELRACAQSKVGQMGFRQTITLVGNTSLPLAFTGNDASSGGVAVSADRALEDLRAAGATDIRVRLDVARPTLKIGSDTADFSVTTGTPGYLYVVQVGTGNNDFTVLFPNAYDSNNYVQAGTVQLPRPNWRVRAGGPAGTGYLMAILSTTPKNFAKGMNTAGGFRSVRASAASVKTLFAEASGEAGSGRFGASAVVPVREVD